MTHPLRETLEQARDALKEHCGGRCNAEYNPCWDRELADKLTAALSSMEAQEPIATVCKEGGKMQIEFIGDIPDGETVRLYAHPPAAAPVGELTDPISEAEALQALNMLGDGPYNQGDVEYMMRALRVFADNRAARPQPVLEPLPLMSEAFRTTVAHGPSEDYRMVFKFKDLSSLDAADNEWRKFRGAP